MRVPQIPKPGIWGKAGRCTEPVEVMGVGFGFLRKTILRIAASDFLG